MARRGGSLAGTIITEKPSGGVPAFPMPPAPVNLPRAPAPTIPRISPSRSPSGSINEAIAGILDDITPGGRVGRDRTKDKTGLLEGVE